MIIAIIILAALFFLALPFAVMMRLQHSTAEQALRTAQARIGEHAGGDHGRSLLYRGTVGVYSGTDEVGQFPHDDSKVDTLWEFRATLRNRLWKAEDSETNLTYHWDPDTYLFPLDTTVGFPCDNNPLTTDGYVRIGEEWLGYTHVLYDPPLGDMIRPATLVSRPHLRGLFGTTQTTHEADETVSFYPDLELWEADIADEQAKININTAPYQVILNLLGYLGIGGPEIPDSLNEYWVPTATQMNIATAISSYRLYYSYWNTDPTDDGQYTRFQSLNGVKNISIAPWFGVGGYPTLSAEEFDRLRPYITVHSEGPAAGAFRSTATANLAVGLNDGTIAGTEEWAARLSPDAEDVPVGSVIKLEDADSEDYRLITSVTRRSLTIPGGGLAAGDLGWFTVSDPSSHLENYRITAPTTNPGTDVYTPAYLYIDDGTNQEWIEISAVDPDNDRIYISRRGQPGDELFGTTASNFGGGETLDGEVVSWRYLEPITSDDYVEPVTDQYDVPSGVYLEERHAININTVANQTVLKSLLNGITNGTDEITPREAWKVAEYMLWYTSGGENDQPSPPTTEGPPYDFFDGNEDWIDGVDKDFSLVPSGPSGNDPSGAVDNGGAPFGTGYDELAAIWEQINSDAGDEDYMDTADRAMLIDNFDPSSPSLWPAVSTVPLRFNSGTLTQIVSTGVADDKARTPVAQAPQVALHRVFDTIPPVGPLYWALRSQEDFDTRASLTNAYTGVLLSTLDAALLAAQDAYTTPAAGRGTVVPGRDSAHPAYQTTSDTPIFTTAVMGMHLDVPTFDLDYSIASDTQMVGAASPNANNTTAEGPTNVHLKYRTRYDQPATQRHLEADPFYAGMQPVAVEFWVRPDTAQVGRALLVDVGKESAADPTAHEATSQIRLYLEEDNRLSVRVDGPLSDELQGDYQGYVRERSSVALQNGEWHHVVAVVAGTFNDTIALFIDGIHDEDAGWSYHYQTDEPTGLASHEATDGPPDPVQEGLWAPLSMKMYDKQYTVDAGPATDLDTGETYWPGSSGEIGIAEDPNNWLPLRGYIVIKRKSGAYKTYAYQGWDAAGDLQLHDPSGANPTPTLGDPIYEGQPLALMIPIWDLLDDRALDSPLSADLDSLRIVGHEEATGAGVTDPEKKSYRLGDQHGPFTVHGTEGGVPTYALPYNYTWLVLDPEDFGNPAAPGQDSEWGPAKRSWALVLHDAVTAADQGALTGAMPGEPGARFSVGAARDGSRKFAGELDELRVTALARARTNGSWTETRTDPVAGSADWYADATLDPNGVGWPYLGTADGARCAVAGTLSPAQSPLFPTGGYFLVEGDLYQYQSYNMSTGAFSGVRRVAPDMSPTAVAGLTATYDPGRVVVPLNFAVATSLAANYASTDADIPVEDAGRFPSEGYVKIDDEIIAYSGKDTTASPHLLLRPAGTNGGIAYPRGAYDTATTAHASGDVVRLLPVRHLDRYRYDEHVAGRYDAGQMNGLMCMASYTVNHAGDLQGVWWNFKSPPRDGQRAVILVRIDGSPPAWESDPETTADLFFEVSSENDVLFFDPPEQVTSQVEVRVYFDIGECGPYRYRYDPTAGGIDTTATAGWEKMIQIDELGLWMTPKQLTF